MPATKGIVEASMRLRGSAPNEWDQFVREVQRYAAETTSEILRAEPAVLLRAQGIAVAMAEFSAVLTNAPQLAEKLRNVQHGR